jgi:hypothetical protein
MMPIGIAVSEDVYTGRVVSPCSSHDDSIDVHQLDRSRTPCGLSSEQVPHRIAAGFAALSAATWCPRCFPTVRAA